MREQLAAARRGARGRNRRGAAGPAVFALALLLAGMGLILSSCYPGVYAVDVFPEMHYQPSFRAYESPRLSPPGDAVPITGRYLVPADRASAADLRSPIAAGQETDKRSAEVYTTNCVPCHGPEGRGNGIVAASFRAANQNPPADFAATRLRDITDGELFHLITNGIGGMPAFGKLLTAEQRWLLIHYVRTVQAKNPAS